MTEGVTASEDSIPIAMDRVDEGEMKGEKVAGIMIINVSVPFVFHSRGDPQYCGAPTGAMCVCGPVTSQSEKEIIAIRYTP